MNLLRTIVKNSRALAGRLQWTHIAVMFFFLMLVSLASAISILGYVRHLAWTGVTDRTFWHWLELLVAPVLLSGGGFLLYAAWAWSDHRLVQKHAHEAARDANLEQIAQKYLDTIQMLMVDSEASEKGQEAHNEMLSAIARARTLNVFDALDPKRKGNTIRFLVAAGLLMEPKQEKETEREKPVKSDTSEVLPSGAGYGPPISSPLFIRLKGANLRKAYLPRATIQGGASFARTHLEEANFEEANLQGANLQRACLWNAILTCADLRGADLRKANLKGAQVTDEQLFQAKFLEGATMPNGQKYEDWLKRNKARGEDGKNGGTS